METEIRRAARRHVERKMGWYAHLGIYLAVNSGLALANLLLAPGKPWALGPLLGWGVGLSFHGLAVWLRGPAHAWKSRMIDKELRRLEGQP